MESHILSFAILSKVHLLFDEFKPGCVTFTPYRRHTRVSRPVLASGAHVLSDHQAGPVLSDVLQHVQRVGKLVLSLIHI